MFEYDLFLSYWEKDSNMAAEVQKKAEDRGLRVFMAKNTIGPSENWEERIRNALIDSQELAFLATRESIKRPWIITECGAHWLLERIVTPILVDCERGEIQSHLMRHQAVEYRDLEKYIEALSARSKSTQTPGGPIKYYERKYPSQVQRTLVAGTVTNSPFQTLTLFNEAKQSMFLAGQNLYFLLVWSQSRMKSLLDDFFEADPSRECKVLIHDPDYKPGVETWSYISDSARFEQDLRRAIDSLEEWVADFKIKGFKFSARLTEFVAVSATFVDPDSDWGRAYFLINTWQQRAGIKACYLLTKEDHTSAFNTYWENYNLAFERASGRQIGEISL
jgi:hypothetical protein